MGRDIELGSFVWDAEKERWNIRRHGIDFQAASKAFFDTRRLIYTDARHSREEERFFCLGKTGGRVATIRFTYRERKIRIIGAGYWRKGRRTYEKENGV